MAFVIGVVAGYFAYRQWKIANDKLRLDLFEKRYAIFTEVKSILAETLQHADVEQERVIRFYRAVRGVEFLFGAEVEAFVEVLKDKLFDFSFHAGQVSAGLDGKLSKESNYQEHVDSKYRLLKELNQFLQSESRSVFEPYLSFSHLK